MSLGVSTILSPSLSRIRTQKLSTFKKSAWKSGSDAVYVFKLKYTKEEEDKAVDRQFDSCVTSLQTHSSVQGLVPHTEPNQRLSSDACYSVSDLKGSLLRVLMGNQQD